ncbi:hypothetical protein E2I00_011711 [Balaenoptera physalus]|uniref:Enkurin domain-containing protein n=1 Tax=Balaenoptera physalus TaxID=9770 RepID=A0A643C1U6_BALPH|nr:hypothetical protein E2I00_011711 [Balaenoptera physalus]
MCEGPSRISGPIPPDPTLCPDYYRRPASAREILERGRRGMGGVVLQLRGISLGPGASPKRKDPKDHEKENLRRIREIQRRFREQEHSREQDQSRPLKVLWRSPKYDKVESHVKAQLQGPGPSVDFITHNARTAKRAPRRHSRSLRVLAQVLEQQRQAQEHYNATQKGHVPHYLLERRDLWRQEAEARQHSQPDPAMPPGHTCMPENQRLETLSNLLQSQSQLLRELVLLPAGADSLRAQSHRAELDRKLVQVEEAIKIFSRPKEGFSAALITPPLLPHVQARRQDCTQATEGLLRPAVEGRRMDGGKREEKPENGTWRMEESKRWWGPRSQEGENEGIGSA